jgi:hypothetical protein
MAPVALIGQQTLSAQDGIATFEDIAFAKVATRLFLKISSPSLPVARWGPIEVVSGPAECAVFTIQPYGAQKGKLFSIQPMVKLSDVAGMDWRRRVPREAVSAVRLSLCMQPDVRKVDAGGNLVTHQSSTFVTAVLEKDRSVLVASVLKQMAAVEDGKENGALRRKRHRLHHGSNQFRCAARKLPS